LRVYLIRLTRGYTDGGMDSRAEEDNDVTQGNVNVFGYEKYQKFSAKGRSAVHVSMREAG